MFASQVSTRELACTSQVTFERSITFLLENAAISKDNTSLKFVSHDGGFDGYEAVLLNNYNFVFKVIGTFQILI